MPQSLNNWTENWQHLLFEPAGLWQIAILLSAAALAALANRFVGSMVSQAADDTTGQLRHLTIRTIKRLLFPATMLLVVLIARSAFHARGVAAPLLDVAVPLMLALGGIRVAVYVVRKALGSGPAVKSWEHVISTTIWSVLALHLLGLLPEVVATLDDLAIDIGKSHISILMVLKLLLTITLFWMLARWVANVVEARLQSSVQVGASMQLALSKFVRFFLLALATLLALDAAGIDLTALAVFGGALGVGLGFGLQRIASNFISGFILLFDRSVQPGAVISVGERFGQVEELRARYIVVRDRDGVETLIPNENLITSEVVNWSYSDPHVRVKIPVSVSYRDDPEQAMAIMFDCAKVSKRVLADPEPAVRLMRFGDSGIDLELRIWIADPENGIAAVRSEINIAIWRAFKQAGITIPFPQLDLHLRNRGE